MVRGTLTAAQRVAVVVTVAVLATVSGAIVGSTGRPAAAHPLLSSGPGREHSGARAPAETHPAAPTSPRVPRPSGSLTPSQSLYIDHEGPRVFPGNPDPPATAPGSASAVSPYASPPAPMGISDLGVGSDGAYSYTTSSFAGFLNITSFGAFSPTNVTNVSTPSPDWVLLQLDAVAVNVSTLPVGASPNATFWVENGLQLNGTTAQLEDNVWNFSVQGAFLPLSSLTGSRGSILQGQEVYAALGPSIAITYPLSIALYDNISIVGPHTVVTFGYAVGDHTGVYDTVTFNGSASESTPSRFLVDGAKLNPNGSYYDAEFVLGGDGYASNADLTDLSANGTLQRWNLTTGAYQAVPSAFDFGVDASETALGVAETYTGTAVRLSPGPSFLDGLWETGTAATKRLAPTATSGALEVHLTVSPSYAFLFATNATLAAGPLRDAAYSFAPTSPSGTLTTFLPPPPADDNYSFAAWADGYETGNVPVNATPPDPVDLSLTASPGTVDAPVYLRGSAQAAAFGLAKVDGTGYSAAASTLWLNASSAHLVAPFLVVNDAYYPTFELVATQRLNDSLVANGFTLASGVENYTTSTGRNVPLVNWSQGYFFFYGNDKDRFTVENTTIEGNSTLANQYSLRHPWGAPPSTAEFYAVADTDVANLSAVDAAVGATEIRVTGSNATDLSATSGSLGLFAYNSSQIEVRHASASGQEVAPSLLIEAVASSSIGASNLSVAAAATAFESLDVSKVALDSLTVTSGAIGFLANYTNDSSVVGLNAGGGRGGPSIAGTWGNSSDLTFQQVTIQSDGLGLNLYGDSGVTVSGGVSTGLGIQGSSGESVSVVESFLNSTKGSFRNIEALNGSLGVDLQNCTDLNVSDITAVGNSTGAFIANASGLSGGDFVSVLTSVGLLLNGTTEGVFSGFVATNDSAGVNAQNSTSLRLSNVSATNATYNNTTYFSTYSGSAGYVNDLPAAGVALTNDTTVTVADVSAFNSPFAVWTNHSSRLTISEVTAWDAVVAVDLNWTNASTVQEVFSWGAQIALVLANSTGTAVGASTLETSVGLGLVLDNGSADTISSDNFVGNDNSSYRGVYNASRSQVRANNSTDATFKGNYWSDWNGSASYPINATDQVTDGHPLSGFYSTYLLFTEKGLPVGANWSLTVAGHSYYLLNDSLLYLPGWILSDGSIPFSVVPIYGYPPHPASGSVGWSGSTQTVQIFFGNLPPSGLPLPLWLLLAIGGGGAAAAAAALLMLRRRKARPAPKPAAGTEPLELPTGPGTPPGPGSGH
jgi:hypothetical protein